jgi:acetyl-CoA carboxylase biotin carboxylase subunit
MIFKKILIANRGEIALRVVRTCHLMGISTVVVYSDADRDALFVNLAEEAIAIGGNTAVESYLDIEKIIAAANRAGADAIHPGYGFLSENADFSARCAKEGIIFIGPSAAAIAVLGNKSAAKNLMQQHNVPTIKGYNGDDQTVQRLLYEAAEIGYPLLVKAAAGGGGKGMRIVRESNELATAITAAKREAAAAFGNDTLLLEQYFENAKHIEVQIIADSYGKVLHLLERECSVQRRFQKIIEEAPSPSLNDRTRRAICGAAVRAIKATPYCGAATVEFILTETGDFYFLEVNTRLQVEHAVTEEITGVDLVRLQIEVAQGMQLDIHQEDIEPFGCAIEARIYAEDPRHNFSAATGNVLLWSEGRIPEVRYESGVETGSTVTTYYDPMLAKVIANAPNRIEAAARLSKALGELCLLGVTTNRSFLMELLRNQDFLAAKMDTKYIERNQTELAILSSTDEETLYEYVVAVVLWRSIQRKATTHPAVQHLPRAWRNNFFAPQRETIAVANENYEVSYRFRKSNELTVDVNEVCFESVQLRDSGENHITLVIDGYKNTYDLATENDTDYYVQRVDYPTEHLVVLPRYPVLETPRVVGNYATAMPGEVVQVCVTVGEQVAVGTPLAVISAMKMETTLYANEAGTVAELFFAVGQMVAAGSVLLRIAATE